MKIPSKNTSAYAVCRIIFKQGPRTQGELVSDLANRFKRVTLTEKVAEMVSIGTLIRTKDTLDIAPAMRRFFDESDAALAPPPKPQGARATARITRPFRPLTGYILPLDGAREGAADHRNYKSRHF